MLTGQNGILNRATEAKEKNEKAGVEENIKLAVMSSLAQNAGNTNITKENLEKALNEQFGKEDQYELTDNGEGSYMVKINANQLYYIDNYGKIINNDNITAINSVNELKLFRNNVNNGNDYEDRVIYLNNNIELDNGEEWIPIGNENNSFKGIFEGGSHTISNIYINGTNDYSGLFGMNSGTIKNLSVSGNINGRNYVGGICGKNENGKVINCKNFSEITSSGENAGGIVGRNNSTGIISECSNNAKINGEQYVAGIAGVSNGGPIYNCANKGQISGKKYIGGIAGFTSRTSVYRSYNVSDISGDYQIGGIIGFSTITTNIENCYNTGNVNGTNSGIGGIVGLSTDSTIILKSYNYSSVQGIDAYGMITGRNDNVVSDCYYISEINCDGYQSENATYSAKRITSGYGTSQDFVNELNKNQSDKVWILDENNINAGYPILSWQKQ